MYFVKFGKRTARKMYFLTPRGGSNSLRIHAAQFSSLESAEKVVTEIERDNPEFRAKVVPRVNTVENLPPSKRIGSGLTMLYLVGCLTRDEMRWLAKLIMDNWGTKP